MTVIKEFKGGEEASRECPNCHSKRNWKDGIRETRYGLVQRFLCRNCGFRFSESSVLSTDLNNNVSRQVCAILTEAKTLTEIEPHKSGLAGATLKSSDIKGKIVEFLWHLNKEGRRPLTIQARRKALTRLMTHGANLYDPESVKETIANEKVSINTKIHYVAAYDGFAKWLNIHWKPPEYKFERKLPWLPTETEIDQLIAGCKRKTAVFLQTLKETMARSGEVWSLKWTDLNGNVLTINNPLKGSNPRQFKIS